MLDTELASINIALEVFAAIISVSLFACFLVESKSKSTLSKLQLIMFAVNAATLLCDAAGWSCARFEHSHVFLDYATNYAAFLLYYVQVTVYTAFVLKCISVPKRSHRVWLNVTFILGALFVLLMIVSMFNKMYFTVDAGHYVRAKLYWLNYIYPAIVLFGDSVILIKNADNLDRYNVTVLLLYSILPLFAVILQALFYGLSLIYLTTTLSLLLIYLIIHVRRSNQLSEKEVEFSRLRSAVMVSQIQPHFIYNVLTAIRTFVTEDPHKAERAIADFSDFLRANFGSLNSVDMIPFEQELNHTKHYLELEKMRFEERLNVVYDIRTVDFCIPSLTLQPIVENAVRHGITALERGGTVRISSFETDDAFVITVCDDGRGYHPNERKKDGRKHIGIPNVQSRLHVQCRGKLEMSGSQSGTTATITIPKER